ncbi:MAG TPA: YggS family pyridoxal phosphate-dependent enzyme [Hellea balneolensis]|uniref:Pyridoxal phosphate homeostasis protein n=1 Tax=Hellea balneolensis TaxID=287478 RepID=A0A7C5R3H2_9PROT|nr:YggS family pyridoxal phosphate-dependent enzyme [Hellea balneolensis]
MTNPIQTRRHDILDRIAKSAKAANRNPADITLIAVSKVQPNAKVADMLGAGQTVFGENRVQEASARWGEVFAEARPHLSLHLIGPLQTNKAAQAVGLFDVIETLDRPKLARALVRTAEKHGKLPKMFVQVNTGNEPQKAGIRPDDVDDFIKVLRTDYQIEPEGLMCIPPSQSLTGQAPGPHFALLKKLAVRNGLTKLSMGMSSDFETAIGFGATHVRVGSALFGPRK